MPHAGTWELILDSSDQSWGNEHTAKTTARQREANGVLAQATAAAGERGAWGWQLDLDLPPLSMQWWRYRGD